ncbi:hypothetical protein K8R43_02240 [archaeon]|nr:hypothetical protein [archaeon]
MPKIKYHTMKEKDEHGFIKKYWWIIPLFAIAPPIGFLVFFIIFLKFASSKAEKKEFHWEYPKERIRSTASSSSAVTQPSLGTPCPRCHSDKTILVNGKLHCSVCKYKET